MQDAENTPPNVLDRQIQSFQFKIQQTLNLQDEEIERLSVLLNNTKTKILEAKERIKELDRDIKAAEEQKIGDAKRRKTEAKTKIAKIKRSHHQEVKDLQDQQTAEVSELQANFETEIDRVSSISNEKNREETAKIEEEMKRIREQTQDFQEKVAQMQKQDESEQAEMVEGLQNVDFEVIEELQYIIEQRNSERFMSLQQSRDKLKQCIETLDRMMRSHAVDLNERQRRLKEIDSKYETELARLEDMHAHKVAMLKGHLDEANKRTEVLMKASHHLERSNQKQLKETMKDLALMKRKSLANSDKPMVRPEDAAKIRELNGLVDKQRMVLASKDEQLRQARSVNEQLKSEVWRLRHELKFNDATEF